MKLKNQVAIVTGGGGGLDEGIALCLAEEGADVVVSDIKLDLAEKAAVIAFSQGMALQMAPHHVNVNTVCPGIIYTPMWQEGSKLLVECHPLFKGSGLKPKDALDAVVETQIPFKTYQIN